MSLGKLMRMSMARKAERAGLQRGDDGPGLGKVLGSALLGPLGSRIVNSGGMRGLSPAMMAIDAIGGRKGRKAEEEAMTGRNTSRTVAEGMKKGGKVKKMAKGGSTASKRADGCATKGKTKGRFV